MPAPTARDMMHAAESRLIGWNPFRADIRWYAGPPNTGADITAFITTAAAENSEIIFPAGAWVINSFPTIPAGVELTALPGATFTGVGASTLGLPFNATGYQSQLFERVTVSGSMFNAGDGAVGAWHFVIRSDTGDATTAPPGLFRGLIVNTAASAGHKGGRSALFAELQVVGAPAVSPSALPGYVGGEFLGYVNSNLTGIAGAFTNYQGSIYGINPTALLGPNATFLAVANASEFDIGVQYGASVGLKFGLNVIKLQQDVSQGVFSDQAIAIIDQPGYLGQNIPATGMIAGKSYVIKTVGTTDFTLVGSPNNTVGTFFNATGAGTGSGVVNGEMPPWGYGLSLGGYSSQWAFDGSSILIGAQVRQVGVPANMLATAMQANGGYKITTVGTTDYTLVGSPNNTVGTIFIATGPATGTGTVVRGQDVANIGIDWRNVLFATYAFASTGFNVNPIGMLTVTPGGTNGELIVTTAALTNGSGAGAGTITNAPSAGNPTKWIKINDNGTIRAVPAW